MARRRLWIATVLACLGAWSFPVAAQKAATPVGSLADWFGPDNYPVAALRAREEGRSVVVLTIDTTGKPTACKVILSSGSATLDDGTCAVAMRRAFFNPAQDRRGRPIPGSFTIPVRWALPENGMPGTLDVDQAKGNVPDMHFEMRVTIAPDGTVTSCAVEPDLPVVDERNAPCSGYPVGKKVMPAMTRSGRPIGAQILMRSDMETVFDP